jgi:SAM-dependent methyltransferase
MATELLPANRASFYEGQDLEALADLPRYYRWILRTFTPYLNGRVLEVGAGTGNFASHYVDGVDQAVLLEPAQNLYPALAARFARKDNVTPICGLLEEWCDGRLNTDGPNPGSFDAAILVNVLEHVANDYQMVQRLTELLRPGGTLLLFVPAVPWLYGTLDSLVHHYRRYTYSRLARVASRSGLELIQLRYFDFPGILPWLIAGRILRQERFNPSAARLYDRLVAPVASILERWIRPPLGKNLICVARRPIYGASSIPLAA